MVAYCGSCLQPTYVELIVKANSVSARVAVPLAPMRSCCHSLPLCRSFVILRNERWIGRRATSIYAIYGRYPVPAPAPTGRSNHPETFMYGREPLAAPRPKLVIEPRWTLRQLLPVRSYRPV